ncbi:MAG: AAA family ATPase [Armatimonas sp.]
MDNDIDRSDFRAFRYSNFNIYDLDGSFEFLDRDEDEMFGHINIFVGENNTGKSRLMREMAKMEIHQVNLLRLVDEKGNSLNKQSQGAVDCIQNAVKIAENIGAQRIIGQDVDFHKRKFLDLSNFVSTEVDKFEDYRRFFDEIDMASVSNIEDVRINDDNTVILLDSGLRVNTSTRNEMMNLYEFLQVLPRKDELRFCNIFIGTLRSLRVVNLEYHISLKPKKAGTSNPEPEWSKIDVYDVFERIYRDEYGFPNAPQTLVFTGMTIYRELIDYLLGLQEKRIIIQRYQEFLSEHFFEGKSIVLMPAIDKGYVRIKIGDEQERVISELGDGLQTVIILTFLPFVKNEQHERAYVYMDEPEMFLHPSMQRKLLYALSTLNFCTFFMTTHSNHLLDITIDLPGVAIFNFQKSATETFEGNPKVIVKKVDSDRSSCLELLGVRNSSVFLANSTIWVEGITDRWYLKKMLDSYIEKTGKYAYKEDIHYAFVEYGGGCITHWSFLDEGIDTDEDPRERIEVEYLCSKAMVIADNDNAADPDNPKGEKANRQMRLKALLGDRFRLLEGKEIENALDEEVIRKTMAELDKRDITDVPAMDRTVYKTQGIGDYIMSLPWSGGPKNKYGAKSGTLSEYWKMKFCRSACQHINYDNLPTDTKQVIESIYSFIEAQNSH